LHVTLGHKKGQTSSFGFRRKKEQGGTLGGGRGEPSTIPDVGLGGEKRKGVQMGLAREGGEVSPGGGGGIRSYKVHLLKRGRGMIKRLVKKEDLTKNRRCGSSFTKKMAKGTLEFFLDIRKRKEFLKGSGAEKGGQKKVLPF